MVQPSGHALPEQNAYYNTLPMGARSLKLFYSQDLKYFLAVADSAEG
jgi:hypothetical protein